MNEERSEKIKAAVRETYAGRARQFVEEPASTGCCGPARASSCCGPSNQVVEQTGNAERLYSSEDLAGLPDSVSEAALGCGDPVAIAELQPGEVVLDLGSGGGIDCFLAARKVGPTGRVIGLDMTPEMLKLAQRNAKKLGARNVEFRYGEIEDIPLPDGSVNVILSNCVINLSPDKDAVFAEAYRVLQPGGRLSVSDVVVDGELPAPLREQLDKWADCVSGALDESDYLERMRRAGFEQVTVRSREYVKISEYDDWDETRSLLQAAGVTPEQLDHKVASIRINAYRPL